MVLEETSPNGCYGWYRGCVIIFYPEEKIYDFSSNEGKMGCCNSFVGKTSYNGQWLINIPLGQSFIYPKNELSYSENFLHMLFSTPAVIIKRVKQKLMH